MNTSDIRYLVNTLDPKGIPVVTPAGVLGGHLDAMKFCEHIPQEEYPAGALAAALYLCSGVRGMERGTVSSVRDENGKEIRKAFIPDEGCLFFSADYSQIELRIMAHLSEDKNMIDAFLSNHDIHAATAAKIYKIDLKDVDSDMRRKAKTANFGIIYGISVFGLAERMNVDRKEAKELIDGYFETYPSVKAYMDKSIQVAQEKGYVETIFHRKRFLPDINSRNAVVRGYAERNAINAPIQGSAADIIKVAMARIYQRFQAEGIQAKMILQVHDELNFSVPVNEKERVEEIVIEEMEKAYRMHVPLKADCGWGKNWLEAH